MTLELLARLGGVASLGALEDGGVSRRDLDRAIRAGDVVRIRNGWFAVPHAPDDVVRAVRVGGVLSCSSLLRRRGVWCVSDRRLHVRVPPNAARLRSPDDRRLPLAASSQGVTVHSPALEMVPEAIDSVLGALLCVLRCMARPHAVASLDSALNKRLVSMEELRSLPGRHDEVLRLVDPSAQSGLESLVRLSLRGRRVRVRPQVRIAGVGFVDLVIGDRLVLELDGWEFHGSRSAFEEDRRRDLQLARQGYDWLRLTYDQVLHEWPTVEQIILEKVRRREHLWGGMHRRAGLA